MDIRLTGASGLVGSQLLPLLQTWGHRVQACPHAIVDGTTTFRIEPGGDAVVHLAGAGVADGRWSARRRRAIRDSRRLGTRALVRAMLEEDRPPPVFVGASAIGFYGDRGDELCDETSAAGTGFLAEVTQEWEAAAQPLRDAGIRVVHLRIGMVLASDGGALKKMLGRFGWGLGGRLGSGRQWISWVHITDLCAMIREALENPAMRGSYNAVAPQALRNAEFTRRLGQALQRPTILPVPGFMLKLLLGEMAEQLLLASTRVQPSRMLEHGFSWSLPDLDAALTDCLSSPDLGRE